MNKDLEKLVNKYKLEGIVVEPGKMSAEKQRANIIKKIRKLSPEHQTKCFAEMEDVLNERNGYAKMLNRISKLKNREVADAHFLDYAKGLTGEARISAEYSRDILAGVYRVSAIWERLFPQKFSDKLPVEILEEIDNWFNSIIDDLDERIKSDPFGHNGNTDFLEKHL